MKLRGSLGVLSILALTLGSVVHAHEGHSHSHGEDNHEYDLEHDHSGHSHGEVEDSTESQIRNLQLKHPDVASDLLQRIDFLETFQEGPKALEKGWITSRNDRYFSSEWIVASSISSKEDKNENAPAFQDEQSLAVHVKHRHYGLTHVLSEPFDNTGKTLVLQYEVRLHEGISCSGAYAKLLLKQDSFDPLALEEATPYVIMFGPDKCGGTNKVHFIVRQKLPNGKWEEKHMAKSVAAEISDSLSHLYTLIIRPDNSFSVLVDEKEQASGNLLSASDFKPPFGAPKEIDDPNDTKPADWVDEEKIPDPSASKPDDWDEDAPKTIPDPDAKKPEDWDDEDDGEWAPPQIPNPEYKGKWTAPIIPNPAYKGQWKPRKIPNPDFFEDEHPSNLAPIGAIAFEILANDRGIAFDNILLTHDEAAAREYAQLTFAEKVKVEKKIAELVRKQADRAERLKSLNEGGVMGMATYFMGEAKEFIAANALAVAATLLIAVFSTAVLCMYLTPESRTGRLHYDDEDEKESEDKKAADADDSKKFSPPSSPVASSEQESKKKKSNKKKADESEGEETKKTE